MQKLYVPEDLESDPSFQTRHQANLIRLMTANIKTKDAIKRKSTGSAQNRTRQNHCRATMILTMRVIIKARDATK